MRSTNCLIPPILISASPLQVKAEVYPVSPLDIPLLVVQAKQHRRYVHSVLCAPDMFSKIAPVVCQRAEDFRIRFLRQTSDNVGPGIGIVHLPMWFQNVQRS